nr:hypothetical protein [Tanacetum cinerariifolium]
MLVQPQAAAKEEDGDDEVPAAPIPPSPTHKPSPPPHEPITTPPQAQPIPPSSPPQAQPTTTYASDMTLINTLMEHVLHCPIRNYYGCSGGCIQTGRRIKAIDADEDITLVDMETEVDLDVELQGRIRKMMIMLLPRKLMLLSPLCLMMR